MAQDLRGAHLPTEKKQALEIVKKLPEKATGDDIMYEIDVQKKIVQASLLLMQEE